MAGIKISALPAVASAQLTDALPVVQGGVTYKETLTQIATLFNSNLTFLPLIGGTMSGAINMGTHQINAVTDPTLPQDAATKAYVDAVATGLTIQGACLVATTGALTVTYANGASGIGATLTNAGAFAALSIDSVSLSVGNRVLVKNQAAPAQNGIYTVTVVGDGVSINWVMTRSTDYDQVSEINPGDLVLIISGTTNTNSSWVETATVATIGTDAITFIQFSASLPISLANGGTGASLVASNGGIFYSTATAGAILAGTATASKVLLSGSTAAPTWSTAIYPSAVGGAGVMMRSNGTTGWAATNFTMPNSTTATQLLYSSATNTVTGLSQQASGVLVSNSSSAPVWSSTMTNGQVIIGSTGATPTAASLTAGTNITITPGAATITIASTMSVLQRVSTETGAVATGTTIIPFDDTIPQNTEGDQYMTLAITPLSATSKLVIDVLWNGANSATANSAIICALFQDATAGALAANYQTATLINTPLSLTLRHIMTSGTTSSTTFKVRVGCAVAGTTTFNGQAAARIFGGVMASSIMITEYSS